jgi:hypothetical protein
MVVGRVCLSWSSTGAWGNRRSFDCVRFANFAQDDIVGGMPGNGILPGPANSRSFDCVRFANFAQDDIVGGGGAFARDDTSFGGPFRSDDSASGIRRKRRGAVVMMLR